MCPNSVLLRHFFCANGETNLRNRNQELQTEMNTVHHPELMDRQDDDSHLPQHPLPTLSKDSEPRTHGRTNPTHAATPQGRELEVFPTSSLDTSLPSLHQSPKRGQKKLKLTGDVHGRKTSRADGQTLGTGIPGGSLC